MNLVNSDLRAVMVGVVLLIGAAGTPVAHAEPATEETAACNYTLSAPFVVDVSGQQMVSATLSSLPCTGSILPNLQTVCVELEAGSAAPKCATTAGYNAAQVYFAPYRPGSTYTSTGTGCAAVYPTQVSTCATQGPLSATL